MANVYLDLPVPLADGAGAPVDVSTLGAVKTVTYQGDVFGAVQVQASLDGVRFSTVYTFSGPARKSLTLACVAMRAFVSNFRAGSAAAMQVASNDVGADFVALPSPAGNGTGAAVDVSALGTLNTIGVVGTWTGVIVVEISADGAAWNDLASFNPSSGFKTLQVVAQYMRVRRERVVPSGPGAPVVAVAAANDSGAGAPSSGVDANALHLNAAAEVSALAAPALAADDVLVVEDADAATPYSKGKATVQSILDLVPGVAPSPGFDTSALHFDAAAEVSALAAPALAADDVLVVEDADAATPYSKGKATVQSILDLVPGVAPSPGFDTSALHFDAAAEVSALAAPVLAADDVVVVEDADAATPYSKGKATIQSILDLVPAVAPGAAGPVAAARGDFIHVHLTATQNGPFTPGTSRVTFDGIVNQSASSVLTLAAGRISKLQPGREYRLESNIIPSNGADNRIQYTWYDVTAGAFIGTEGASRSVAVTAASPMNSSAVAIIVPTTETEVEIRVTSVAGSDVNIVSDAFASGHYNSYAIVQEVGAVQANVIGGLEFMDEIVVASAGQDFSFGAAGDGLFQRALDGDADDEYVIIGDVVKGTATLQDLSIEPNGLTTNQLSTQARFINASATPSVSQAAYLIAANTGTSFAAGTVIHFEATLRAKTGQGRGFVSSFGADDGADSLAGHSGGSWDESATVLTSLGIHSQDAGGIDAGSRFCLYRRTRNNLRADSADTYVDRVEGVVTSGIDSTLSTITAGPCLYGGSVVGVGVELQSPLTAGTLTVSIKVGGVTKASVQLSTANPSVNSTVVPIGSQTFGRNDLVTFEIVTAGGYTHSAGGTTGVVCKAQMQNSALFQGPAGGKQHIKTIRVENAAQSSDHLRWSRRGRGWGLRIRV